MNAALEKPGGRAGGVCVGVLRCSDSRVQDQPLTEEGKERGGEGKEGGREAGREDHMEGRAPPLAVCGQTPQMFFVLFIPKCLMTVITLQAVMESN